jgi:hypothetical protein
MRREVIGYRVYSFPETPYPSSNKQPMTNDSL